MTATKLAMTTVATAVLVVAVVVGGVAAAPADVPEHATADGASNATDQAVAERPDVSATAPTPVGAADSVNRSAEPTSAGSTATAAPNAAGVGDDRPGAAGSADDVPEQAADHVAGVHATIESFLDGTVDHLGNRLSELVDGSPEPADDAGNDA